MEPDWCREKGRTRMTDNLRLHGRHRPGGTGQQRSSATQELVDAAIERVEKLNGELNAMVTTLFERPGGRSR